jgi:uncharacterized protein
LTDIPYSDMREFEKTRYLELLDLGEPKKHFTTNIELSLAIRGNDYRQVRRLISSGIDVNISNETNYTSLMYACELGRLHIVDLLISSGAHVNIQDTDGNTSLLIALRNRHVDAGHKLLDNDADVNLADKNGNTPLMTAAELGDLDILDRLFHRGARIDARNKGGYTPVFYAVLHPAVLKLLISKGADINDNQSGTTLLLQTLGWSRDSTITREVFDLLISSGINVNARAKNGETALMRAKNINERDIVTLLINNGADTSH